MAEQEGGASEGGCPLSGRRCQRREGGCVVLPRAPVWGGHVARAVSARIRLASPPPPPPRPPRANRLIPASLFGRPAPASAVFSPPSAARPAPPCRSRSRKPGFLRQVHKPLLTASLRCGAGRCCTPEVKPARSDHHSGPRLGLRRAGGAQRPRLSDRDRPPSHFGRPPTATPPSSPLSPPIARRLLPSGICVWFRFQFTPSPLTELSVCGVPSGIRCF